MTTEDKQRIDRESSCYAQGFSTNGFRLRMAGYVAGAVSEHERMAEQLKQERNKAIDEAKIKVKGLRDSVSEKEYGKTYFNIAYTSVIIELENLKH